MSLVPTTAKAEIHLTYRCDLTCSSCNRASFLRRPHTPDMTRAQLANFFAEADALGWKPRIILVGGEPTLHPEFDFFVEEATVWSGEPVQIFSNGYHKRTKEKLVELQGYSSVTNETWKPDGSVRDVGDFPGWTDDCFVSPEDLGRPLRPPCFQHASIICGVSVDSEGYAPCAMGGGIEGVLGVGGRTKRLADLFDPEEVERLTAALCRHCGFQGVVQNLITREEVDAQERRFDSPMSETWLQAFEGRK